MDELRDLAGILSQYDVVDLLASAAALQLVPENADRAIRFEALSHVIAAVPYKEGKPQISRHKLANICNTPPLGKGFIESQEDPSEQAFAEAFTFIGGSYTVFPGIAADATFILKHLNRAIFLAPDPFPNRDFVQAAHDANLAILTLSNEIADRIGISGNYAPEPMAQQNVVVPSNLQQLKNAVTFTRNEVERMLGRTALPTTALEDFITEAGSVDISRYEFNEGELQGRPLVRADDRLIVALPGRYWLHCDIA